MSRTISWFSCGAPSAVATKLALAEGPVTIGYCEVKEENDDNKRFREDCEKWFDQEIVVLGNDKYERSIYNVFKKTRYLVGTRGARCTKELKKSVRESFELPTDRHVFGYTVEEQNRVDTFIDANNDVDIWPILIEKGLTKADCKGIINRAGIELPKMYKLGYHNNNCIGCVKGESGYWNKIRVDFPQIYEKMAQMEEYLGNTVCKIDMGSVSKKYPEIWLRLGKPPIKNEKGNPTYWRPTLRELPIDAGNYPQEQSIECGIFCIMAEQDINRDLIISSKGE